MKVYFGTSPRIKQLNEGSIEKIYTIIEDLGHTHTSDFVLKVVPEKFYRLSTEEFNRHHEETIRSIRRADVCIFEASQHSLSVGYLVNYSLDLGKPVIILARDNDAPFMFKSIKSERLFFVFYKDNKDLKRKLKRALEKAASRIDVRFNFFITPQLLSYLDWIAGKKRIPRSVYLRNLIEEDMKRNKEYQKELVDSEEGDD
jgi:hypothetical protein